MSSASHSENVDRALIEVKINKTTKDIKSVNNTK